MNLATSRKTTPATWCHIAHRLEIAIAQANKLNIVILPWHPPESIQFLLKVDVGDRVYLGQEWQEYDDEILLRDPNIEMDDISEYEESWLREWQPAKTLPPDGTTHHYIIQEIAAIEAKDAWYEIPQLAPLNSDAMRSVWADISAASEMGRCLVLKLEPVA